MYEYTRFLNIQICSLKIAVYSSYSTTCVVTFSLKFVNQKSSFYRRLGRPTLRVSVGF